MKADHSLAVCFVLFVFYQRRVLSHTLVFEWQIDAKNLSVQHFFRDRQDFDRGSYKMMSFDTGTERKNIAGQKSNVMIKLDCKLSLSPPHWDLIGNILP